MNTELTLHAEKTEANEISDKISSRATQAQFIWFFSLQLACQCSKTKKIPDWQVLLSEFDMDPEEAIIGRGLQYQNGSDHMWYRSSPELYRSTSFSKRSDVFTLGMMFWVIMCGEIPYDDSDIECMEQVGEPVKPQFTASIFSDDYSLKEVILQCIKLNPKDRPNLKEILTKLTAIENKLYEKELEFTIDESKPLGW